MKKAVLKLTNKTIIQLVAILRAVIKAMTGNSNFPDPNPDLPTFATAIDELDAKEAHVIQLRQQLKVAMTERDNSKKTVKNMATTLVAYVQQASGGDENKILSAGMLVQAFGVRAKHKPERVANLQAHHNDDDMNIVLRWDAMQGFGRVWYHVRYTFTNPEANPVWFDYQSSTSATSIIFKDAEHVGQRVYVEVCAVNARGAGPWSQAAEIIIAAA